MRNKSIIFTVIFTLLICVPSMAYEGWSAKIRVNQTDTTGLQGIIAGGMTIRDNGKLAMVWENSENDSGDSSNTIHVNQLEFLEGTLGYAWGTETAICTTGRESGYPDDHPLVIQHGDSLAVGYFNISGPYSNIKFYSSYIDSTGTNRAYFNTIAIGKPGANEFRHCAAANFRPDSLCKTIFVWYEPPDSVPSSSSRKVLRYTDLTDSVWNTSTDWVGDLDADTAAVSVAPTMVTDSEGNIHMLFVKSDTSGSVGIGRICYMKYDDSGWDTSSLDSIDTGDCWLPWITYCEKDINLHAVWLKDSSGVVVLKYAKWPVDSDISSATDTTLVTLDGSSNYMRRPNIAALTNGKLMVVWNDSVDSNNNCIKYLIHNSTSWQSIKTVINYCGASGQALIAQDSTRFNLCAHLILDSPAYLDVFYWEYPLNLGFIPGDANGDTTLSGLDVTYHSNYFKGGPPPPIMAAADANASCYVTGLDVIYLSNYFKGGPAPLHGICDWR
ncbi:MAG: hypothetical protein JSU85_15835 [Candidatus Zixiibacteriota bacterium]|nr:MAG: hypothetical protein JSU85_15835 [candidate division Zixibacteria bacterium]